MLLYLSESKLNSIIEEIHLLKKESLFSKFFDSVSAKVELKHLTVEGRVNRQDRNSMFNEHDSGILDYVTKYLESEKKLHKFTPKTKRLKIMDAYNIVAKLSLSQDDNPEVNMENSNNLFEYMIKNPDEITTLKLMPSNKNFQTIKVDCSNKYIWFMGMRNYGEEHLKSWSMSQRWDLKNSIAIVRAIVFITRIDEESSMVYGSPLYINV